MKREVRQQARALRQQGYSVKQICRELGVAKSSVSLWVRDIPLTEEQLADLKRRHPIYHGQYAGSQAVAAKHRAIREQYQQEGRAKACEGDLLHQAGCMLYWGEGAKSRNMLTLSNSDPEMMQFYMKFIRHAFNPSPQAFRLHISCYGGNGLEIAEIEDFWLTALDLPTTCLGKTAANVQPISSQQKGRKLFYGVCALRICSTRIVQHVLGAIQEYAGIDKPEWLL